MVAVGLLPLLTGCFCTIEGREYSVPEVKPSARLEYTEVRDVTALKKWNSTAIPVTVTATYTTDDKQKNGWDALHILCFCWSLGIIPFWEKTETVHSVNVQSPLGPIQGTCVETKRKFMGWVPYLLPFASWNSEEDGEDEEEIQERRAKVCQKELTSRLVSQFAPKWNAAVERAQKRNADIAKEKRVAATRTLNDRQADIGKKRRAAATRTWNARQIEILRTFALKESPTLWETVQTLRAERGDREAKLKRLREDLTLFGRDPDTDTEYLALRRAIDDIGASVNAVYGKIEEAYIAYKKFQATPGRQEYSETMRRALEDGINEAAATERRYKEMTRQK